MAGYRAQAAPFELESSFDAVMALLINHVRLHTLRLNAEVLYISTRR